MQVRRFPLMCFSVLVPVGLTDLINCPVTIIISQCEVPDGSHLFFFFFFTVYCVPPRNYIMSLRMSTALASVLQLTSSLYFYRTF